MVDSDMTAELKKSKPYASGYKRYSSSMNHRVPRQTLIPRHSRQRRCMILATRQKITLKRIVAQPMRRQHQKQDHFCSLCGSAEHAALTSIASETALAWNGSISGN